MTMCITSLRCTAHSELDTEPPKHHHHLERSLLYISLFSILAEGLGHPAGLHLVCYVVFWPFSGLTRIFV